VIATGLLDLRVSLRPLRRRRRGRPGCARSRRHALAAGRGAWPRDL